MVFLVCCLQTLCLAQNSSAKKKYWGKVSVETYGYPGNDIYQRRKVAHHYGFRLETIAGCLISDAEITRAEKHNKKAYKIIAAMNGEQWEEAYEKEVSASYRVDTTIVSYIQSDSIVKWVRLNYNTWAHVDSNITENVYRVNFYAYSSHKLASVLRVYFDYAQMKILRREEELILVQYKTLPGD